ncbi:hypothetical protein SAMN05216261_0186 [Algibacter luteus]|uniref:Uncharacterized protein n=1 Tax=Algibacter luteus TaxID=1178825 RepID=A0A1M6A379_9FLAO|nr:hypothetical protein SAMN05216261_0186 [Algibacter luteus]
MLHIYKPFQIVNTGTLHSVETIDKKNVGHRIIHKWDI